MQIIVGSHYAVYIILTFTGIDTAVTDGYYKSIKVKIFYKSIMYHV